MFNFFKKERDKWPTRLRSRSPAVLAGLSSMVGAERELYEQGLPRGVRLPRFTPDRPRVNYFMSPDELSRYAYRDGQIILGKFGSQTLGHLDDRPIVTIAGARAGKTSTVLEPNLYRYPGSMLVLDPKGELAAGSAQSRRACGHKVLVLDPFGQSGEASSHFNPLAELDPESPNIVDDADAITHALIVDDGGQNSQHWTNSARALLKGIILLTLTLPPVERNLVTVRELLTLTYPGLIEAMRKARAKSEDGDEGAFDENRAAVQVLLKSMSNKGSVFGGILAAIGNRFLGTPQTERGGIFSTASAQIDFLDSLPLRAISRRSDFRLEDLRGDRPVTIYMCLGVSRMDSHYRWMRLIVQLACNALERMGRYPRDRAPILFLMEEFATLGQMKIMERAAAYFPGFGVKLWCVLQDVGQLKTNYPKAWETFLGNAGLIQCFSNGDQATLEYLTRRLEKLMEPFELRQAFAREKFTQLLLFEGAPPAAAARLSHDDVERMLRRLSFKQPLPKPDQGLPVGTGKRAGCAVEPIAEPVHSTAEGQIGVDVDAKFVARPAP